MIRLELCKWEMNNYIHPCISRYYDPDTGSYKYNTSGDDFVMNSFKLPVEEFRQQPRIALPLYDGEAWRERNESWGWPRDA